MVMRGISRRKEKETSKMEAGPTISNQRLTIKMKPPREGDVLKLTNQRRRNLIKVKLGATIVNSFHILIMNVGMRKKGRIIK